MNVNIWKFSQLLLKILFKMGYYIFSSAKLLFGQCILIVQIRTFLFIHNLNVYPLSLLNIFRVSCYPMGSCHSFGPIQKELFPPAGWQVQRQLARQGNHTKDWLCSLFRHQMLCKVKKNEKLRTQPRLRFYHCHKHKRCKTRRLSRAACVAWVSFSLGFV